MRTRTISRVCGALLFSIAAASTHAAPTLTQLLSGTGSDDTVDWEFKVSGGRRAGEWATIPVPSNWEMQGFGTYRYWRDFGTDDEVPDKTGWYRHRFNVPAAWKGLRIDLVFGAVMTDAEVRVNGRSAGPIHQGGFYEFRFEVTDLLNFGAENLLEVTVHRFSANASVNFAEREADYWLFSGIHRPVWLEARPAEHIAHVAIDARHDGRFAAGVEVAGIATARRAVARVQAADGAALEGAVPITVPISPGQTRVRLEGTFAGVKSWSAEWPHLHTVDLELADAAGGVIHTERRTFGFRTVEVRPGIGFFVNGEPVRLRGVNRHTIWPETGRTTNATLSARDVALMKEMNMNAVRMSHYPPESHFLEACDRLGLYVIDELGGWQKAYDSIVGPGLVRETVRRDVNHPSIVLWANGNEGGWNTDLDDDFGSHDPQGRTVIHPWQNFNGIDTSHYLGYGCCADTFFNGHDLILPTEFLHALYDGGGAAGLDDWWKLMMQHPLAVGGFIWAFADEGVVRADQGGRIDVAGNAAPDGVVGPFRQKEGSFFAIKEIWSPVHLPMGEVDRLFAGFDGTLRVENRYDFTNLRDVRFRWELRDFPGPDSRSTGHTVAAAGEVVSPDVPARASGALRIDLPDGWHDHDAFALRATDPRGAEIYTWTWMIRPAGERARIIVPDTHGEVAAEERGDSIVLRAADAGVEVAIARATGRLFSARRGGTDSPLRDGPRAVTGDSTLTDLRHFGDAAGHVVECRYEGVLQLVRWRLAPSGWLQLEYTYRNAASTGADALGITFDFDEAGVTGMRWLGKGPFRVWKNRRKGVEFDVWHKSVNDTATGASWDYPEFKGFHDNVSWATIEGGPAPLTVVMATDDLFLRVFTPAEGPEPRTTHVIFPPGDLSILQGIAPIGTKFHLAADHGPAGAQNFVSRDRRTTSATVYFRFGDPTRGL